MLLIMAAGLAAAGLMRAAGAGAADDATRVEQIAASLRCATCQGLSVADSPSQLADGMRDIIIEQVAAGRSPDQVREWFVDRYGPWILLSPGTTGVAAAVWLLPIAAVAAGVLVAWRRVRRDEHDEPTSAGASRSRRLVWSTIAAVFAALLATGLTANVATRGSDDVATGDARSAGPVADAGPPPLATLRTATVEHPDDPQAWLALALALDEGGDLDAALRPYERALSLADGDPDVQRAAASALVRADRPAAAEPVLLELEERYPDDAEIVLLLGTTQRALDRFGAEATLQRFLQLAPDHPAAGTVRTLVDDGADR